ncbi:sensor domain-containing diguanylate cyclase [Metapseudomonas furukawaii]|jgi:diguanylate cyclase (GGDEF)-like protein/PAS domain S-box-containing protein|uniref:diguanylate cyclase n=1 Tax=Metapseudomonas furukawaii TaxID=1149133 RepID=A0AAD1BV85_METFU|nr:MULTISPECIES: sensor domain-containing diguanylate cyclase [Pseudomonas]ELS28102.1 diguanylate cyclase/phosphodiesterase [Pseudomonas furukawaii]OWJ90758.1 GGDEF domain-containing protein [Pseudomonas sp. A46]BAU71986.1 diguanylate cyclase/phosphodiesterase (GGDEF & EAL domains) with PAS/PAC sensor(s) [Pseudomonas furukawaii]
MEKLDPEPLDHCYGTTLEEVERTLRFALDIVSDGIWDWNIRTNHVKRSPGWYSMLGYPQDGLPEDVDTWKSVIHPGDYERVMRNFQAYVSGESQIYAEDYRCRCRDGSYLWVSDHGRFVEFDEDGRPTRMIGAHRDIHRRKMASLELQRKNEELLALNRRLESLVAERTEELRRTNEALAQQVATAMRLSETDPLTQVSNRRHFERALHGEWQRFQRHGHATALLMFDLDHFKRINDQYGHQIGDRALVAVSRSVRGALREEDCFARWGGEEFIALLPETDLESALRLAERLRQRVPQADPGLPRALTASFSVAAMQAGEGIESLLKRLDDGLYRAKLRRDCIEAC